MRRKALLAAELAVLAAVAVVLLLTGDGSSGRGADERPNILLIYTDDQRWDTLESMPAVMERIAGEGMLFTRAFVTTPLCCPSRASLLTGLYANQHGVLTNSNRQDGGHANFDDSSTLATWLDDAGYETSYIGKYLNGYEAFAPYVPPGWDDWHVFVGLGYYKYSVAENGGITGADGSTYSTDFLLDRALDFVASAKGPFFQVFAPYAPHAAAEERAPHRAIPAERHECDLPQHDPAPSFNEEDLSDKPQELRNVESLTERHLRRMEENRVNAICSLRAVDEAVAALLDALGDELDHTVVIFTSDNGLQLGEHRLDRLKGVPYEESIRVPLVIRFPPLIASPGKNDSMVSNLDLAPTIVEVAGLAAPSMSGTSLVPILVGEETRMTGILIENFEEQRTFSGIRDSRWVYVEWASGDVELYDLPNDPYQLESRANDPGLRDVVERMHRRLEELLERPAGVSAAALP